MVLRLSGSPSAGSFSEVLAERVLVPTAERLAGPGGRLDRSTLRQVAQELTGPDRLAADALAAFAQVMGPSASVREFVAFAQSRAAEAARSATGADGRLSSSDAAQLPADLKLAFHFLRTGELPDAPAPRLRFSEAVLSSVMAAYGIADRHALLEKATELDDGNRYLRRAELEAAAAALRGPALPALADGIPADWRAILRPALETDRFRALDAYVRAERAAGPVYPPEALTFAALKRTPVDKVKVVFLGQDPYHGEGEATGLSFSLPRGVAVPSSLKNIFKELHTDLGVPPASHGNLEAWADRGVLLLNTALTVRKDEPGSHRRQGWEELTDAILDEVNAKDERVVFVLLGKDAQKKAARIDTSRHTVVTAAHPSGLSANRGFFGSRPFSKVNDALAAAGRDPIDWTLPL